MKSKGKIIIEKLKGIDRLEFDLPDAGFYILTGTNGSGKTTLLTCIRRIKDGAAFSVNFRTGPGEKLNQHKGAKITYCIGDEKVVYRYINKRWMPKPRDGHSLFNKFKYSQLIYAGADAKRITPNSDDISKGNIKSAPDEIKESMNSIFRTKKFDKLYYVSLGRGRSGRAYLIKSNRNSYFTENNFGLGELCVLKLLIEIKDSKDGAIVLIDELEMALHPMAQIRFAEHLKKLSEQKNLIVIVSTHSSTLIKYFNRSHIIFIEKKDNKHNVLLNCYPSYVLGSIGYGEERSPDYLIYVEDDMAKEMLYNLWNLYKNDVKLEYSPSIAFVPIGGISQIETVMSDHGGRGIFPEYTNIFACPDNDILTYRKGISENELNKRNIIPIPFTPEVKLLELMSKNKEMFEIYLRKIFHMNHIVLPDGELNKMRSFDNHDKNVRSMAKDVYGDIKENIMSCIVGVTEKELNSAIIQEFCRMYYKESNGYIRGLFGKILHKKNNKKKKY